MLKLSHVLVIVILFLSISSFAQRPNGGQGERPTFTVTGKIVDKSAGIPLEYATISFQSLRNPKELTGGISGTDGTFSIEVPQGRYKMTIEYISFQPYVVAQQIVDKNLSLGTVTLYFSSDTLDEVVIRAETTQVDIRLDKKIYNVGKDLLVRGGSVSDVLDNVPSVSVDVEGNVSLRGNDNVRILINGKPSGLVGISGSEGLRQIPSDAIERVEVITSPSARYDAEGTGGILNIILKKDRLIGFNGSVNATVGDPENNTISATANFRTKDINLFTNTGYSRRASNGYGIDRRESFNPDLPFRFVDENRDFERLRKSFNTNLGLEWFVTETSTITNSFFYRTSDNESNNATISNRYADSRDNLSNASARFDDEAEKDNTFQYSLNFVKDFSDDGHKFTFDFQYEDSKEDEFSTITDTDTFPTQMLTDVEQVRTIEEQNEILLQTDYVWPIDEDTQFEAGYRGTFDDTRTDYSVAAINGNNNFIRNDSLSNVLGYKEYVNAVYSQYGKKIKKFSVLFGLRLEQTRITIDQETTGDLNKKNYTSLFPTLNLGYEFTEKSSLTLGYNRRIRRPRSRFINPFPSRSSEANLFQGNPDLDPVFSNGLDLGFLRRWKGFTLNSSIYYTRSTDVFEFISEDTGQVTNNGDAVVRRFPVNLSSEDRYGFELTLMYKPAKWWTLNSDFNLFKQMTDGNFNGQDFSSEITSYFVRLNSKVTFPYKIDFQTRLFYSGPRNNAQSETEGVFSSNIAFSKDLFKENATISLNVSDVFNTRVRRTQTLTNTFASDSEFQWRSRQATLSFTYRFNQKKQRERGRPEGGDDEGGDFEG